MSYLLDLCMEWENSSNQLLKLCGKFFGMIPAIYGNIAEALAGPDQINDEEREAQEEILWKRIQIKIRWNRILL